MGYGELITPAGPWRSHDAPPSPTRDGADCTLKQHLWGARYVDDLVQIAVNDDPTDANEADCESFYYPMQNANFNVIGLTDANGTLVERYEYTPYGQRTVYKKAGIDDELTTAPLVHSQRVETDAGRAPYGLCDVGHQGLMHDEQFGLVYNRFRYLEPRTGRWTQRDPAGYVDGMNPQEYVRSSPVGLVDPRGGKAVRWEAVPAPGLGTARGFEKAMYDAMGNAGRWTNWLYTTEAGHRYIRDSKLLAIVKDRGVDFGHLRIDTFNKRKEWASTPAGWVFHHGLNIEGGFVAYNDPHGHPHCCKELRWSQILLKESYAVGYPNRAGRFDHHGDFRYIHVCHDQ